MDIEKELKEIEKDVINIENKVDGLGKKSLLFFLWLFTNPFMLACQLLLFIPTIFWGMFTLFNMVNYDTTSLFNFVKTIGYMFSPLLPLFSTFIFEHVFKISKRKKLTKKEQKIFNLNEFFFYNYRSKKLLKYLTILFSLSKHPVNKDYFNSIINFLEKKSDHKLKKELFNYFSYDLLDFLRSSKINLNEFNDYFFKYIKALKIEDKKTISTILKRKNLIIENSNSSKEEVQDFLSSQEILDKRNQSILQKDNIKF